MESTLATSSAATGPVTFSHVFGQQCQLMEAGTTYSLSGEYQSNGTDKNRATALVCQSANQEEMSLETPRIQDTVFYCARRTWKRYSCPE
ncbi:Hypothetical predicted protein [Marmota monax]|uniref:Uncharacterized protein n=1 Tax=Marmota monax TaxID=9995 RepID=A0A5E4CTV3_MARMO|nr:Hypothetical predicted protein [Marmota monax]